MSSLLVRLFGWRAQLFHGDPLVYDRWCWITKRLRQTRNGDRLLDVGCGSGAFTIGTAKLGYHALGLSWDERNQGVAEKRARISGAKSATFEICDVRALDQHQKYVGQFDVVLCCENIEHIIDDFRLMKAMAACLNPGGRLLLTTPHMRRVPINAMDYGPFPDFEDGRHVRRGYNRAMIEELCRHAGLAVDEISYVSGPVAQVGASVLWRLGFIHTIVGWLAILPLRPIAPWVDPVLMRVFGAAPFCIGLEAYKPRIPAEVAGLPAAAAATTAA